MCATVDKCVNFAEEYAITETYLNKQLTILEEEVSGLFPAADKTITPNHKLG